MRDRVDLLAAAHNGWYSAYVLDAGTDEGQAMITIYVEGPDSRVMDIDNTLPAPAAYAVMKALTAWNEAIESEAAR